MNVGIKNKWLGWEELPNIKEGRCTDVFLNTMYDIVSTIKPKTILEIGFNGGHSACCFLNASPTAKMYTFDICRWGIEEKAESILKRHFDINLIKGNSVQTIPEFLSKNKLLFDLILIDGCHDYDVVVSDIKNTMNLLNNDGILVVDDLHMGGVYNAVIDTKLEKLYDSKLIDIDIISDIKINNPSQLCNYTGDLKIEKQKFKILRRPFMIFKNRKIQ
jgi:predicted O-methyltransferase YrrM